MADAKKIVRMLWLYDYLREGGVVRTADAAARLGVSQRAIQRDLLDLQSAPLYTPLVTDNMGEWRWINTPRSSSAAI